MSAFNPGQSGSFSAGDTARVVTLKKDGNHRGKKSLEMDKIGSYNRGNQGQLKPRKSKKRKQLAKQNERFREESVTGSHDKGKSHRNEKPKEMDEEKALDRLAEDISRMVERGRIVRSRRSQKSQKKSNSAKRNEQTRHDMKNKAPSSQESKPKDTNKKTALERLTEDINKMKLNNNGEQESTKNSNFLKPVPFVRATGEELYADDYYRPGGVVFRPHYLEAYKLAKLEAAQKLKSSTKTSPGDPARPSLVPSRKKC